MLPQKHGNLSPFTSLMQTRTPFFLAPRSWLVTTQFGSHNRSGLLWISDSSWPFKALSLTSYFIETVFTVTVRSSHPDAPCLLKVTGTASLRGDDGTVGSPLRVSLPVSSLFSTTFVVTFGHETNPSAAAIMVVGPLVLEPGSLSSCPDVALPRGESRRLPPHPTACIQDRAGGAEQP